MKTTALVLLTLMVCGVCHASDLMEKRWFDHVDGTFTKGDVPHRFRNAGDVPARALMIFRPGGFDELIGEMREPGAAGKLSDDRRRAILEKWGVYFDNELKT